MEFVYFAELQQFIFHAGCAILERTTRDQGRSTQVSFESQDFHGVRQFKNPPVSPSSSEVSAYQMAPSGVIAHWRGRRALEPMDAGGL